MQIDVQHLTEKFEENPVAFMAAAGGLLMGMSKIIEAVAHHKGATAFAKDAARRARQSKK